MLRGFGDQVTKALRRGGERAHSQSAATLLLLLRRRLREGCGTVSKTGCKELDPQPVYTVYLCVCAAEDLELAEHLESVHPLAGGGGSKGVP